MNTTPLPIPHILTKARLSDILAQFPSLKAGVIGDIGLDAYWYADMTRSHLSRETPHYPRPIVREAYAPGAGGNVAQNLVALGLGQVSIFSVFGEDTWGSRLKAELSSRSIRIDGILTHPARCTIAFIKPILIGYNAQQEDARLDFESCRPLTPETEQALLEVLESQLSALDMVLLADQQELFEILTPTVRQRLTELAASHPRIQFLVDSRQRIGLYRRMVIKPNWVEAAAAVDSTPPPDARPPGLDTGVDSPRVSWPEMVAIGQKLSLQSGRPVFITLSEQGVLVCTPDAGVDSTRAIAAAPVQPPLDPVGAGDAFIAALAAALSAGASPWEAGAIANLAAAVTVEKLNQTGTATPQEILERYDLAKAMKSAVHPPGRRRSRE